MKLVVVQFHHERNRMGVFSETMPRTPGVEATALQPLMSFTMFLGIEVDRIGRKPGARRMLDAPDPTGRMER